MYQNNTNHILFILSAIVYYHLMLNLNEAHLGMVYLGLGEEGQAQKYLHLALESKEDFPGRQDAERVLRGLG